MPVRDYKNLCDRQRTNKKHALLHKLSNISQVSNHEVCRFLCLSVAVKALAFEVKIVTVTARFGVFQVFIIQECCRFLHARQY